MTVRPERVEGLLVGVTLVKDDLGYDQKTLQRQNPTRKGLLESPPPVRDFASFQTTRRAEKVATSRESAEMEFKFSRANRDGSNMFLSPSPRQFAELKGVADGNTSAW